MRGAWPCSVGGRRSFSYVSVTRRSVGSGLLFLSRPASPQVTSSEGDGVATELARWASRVAPSLFRDGQVAVVGDLGPFDEFAFGVDVLRSSDLDERGPALEFGGIDPNPTLRGKSECGEDSPDASEAARREHETVPGCQLADVVALVDHQPEAPPGISGSGRSFAHLRDLAQVGPLWHRDVFGARRLGSVQRDRAIVELLGVLRAVPWPFHRVVVFLHRLFASDPLRWSA